MVGIDGITPAIIAENYLLIDQSGTFTMTVPDGVSITAHIVGGGYNGGSGYLGSEDDGYDEGGSGGQGGYVFTQSFSNISSSDTITCSIGTVNGGITTLKIANTTYSSNNGTRNYGGSGGYYGHPSEKGKDGTLTPYGYVGSSGGGGGRKYGTSAMTPPSDGGIGAGNGSYDTGTDATNYGCGGGGGGVYNSNTLRKTYSGGAGKQGCIIIAWE